MAEKFEQGRRRETGQGKGFGEGGQSKLQIYEETYGNLLQYKLAKI